MTDFRAVVAQGGSINHNGYVTAGLFQHGDVRILHSDEGSVKNGLFKIFSGCLALVLSASIVIAEERVDYLRQIKPILAARCFACHGALKQESNLRLDTGVLIRKGGDSGPSVEPGNAKNSVLLQRISATDESERMPSLGKPLTQDQIDLIKRWIEQGATSPTDEQPEEDPKSHWSFQKLLRPSRPQVNNSAWVYNPVDAFIAAEHQRQKLKPNSLATKHILLRRVTLDLTGLPPTRKEYHAFRSDDSPQAYEKLVNRLLNSPQYGERWGRHWMDVWRYSDWYGRRTVNDVRNSYPHIWRWRDWIINSLNEDKGYDRMVMEMLAADEIAPEDDDAIVATGYLVRNWFSLNYDQWMKDIVEHTGKAFLGLRLNCAHCHDHKYDPISQQEYFRFRAFFEPLELRHDRVPGGPAVTKYKRYVPGSGASLKPIKAGLARVFDFDLKAETYMYSLGDARSRIKDEPPVSPGAPAFLGGDTLQIKTIDLPPSAWYPGLKSFVRKEETTQRQQAIENAKAALATAKQNFAGKTDSVSVSSLHLAEARLANALAQLKAFQARVAADHSKHLQNSDEKTVVDLAIKASHAERNAFVSAAKLALAEAEKLLTDAKTSTTSDAKQKSTITAAQKKVQAATKSLAAAQKNLKGESDRYALLSPTYPQQSTGRRKALAEWIANNENPLTARVAVNHIWMRHFGRPLVESVFDFGRSGKTPTHPQLLDWLADELIKSGWSMKHLHRLIVTSHTYQLASAVDDDVQSNLIVDSDNRYWWRFERRRLEAEAVRDSVLHATGQLDLTQGGPELENTQGETSSRRTMYYMLYPTAGGTMKFMELFNPPNPADCYRRRESIVPQQALGMVNGNITQNQSRLLARKLSKQIAASHSDLSIQETEFIEQSYEQILTRSPSSVELKFCREFLQKQAQLFQKTDPKQLQTSAAKGVTPASTNPAIRARESLVRVLLNHNDFVTIP